MLLTTQLDSLSTDAFACLVDISPRKARAALARCHDGHAWRGVKLDVVLLKGTGGRSGLQYLVRRDSIPAKFIKNPIQAPEQALPAENKAVPVPVERAPTELPALPRKQRHLKPEADDFKLKLIHRIRRETDPGTPERAALIRELAQTERYPYGKRRGQLVGTTTLKTWVRLYTGRGIGGIARKAREDAGKRRVLISRHWNKEVDRLGLGENERKRLADELKRHVASQWRSGTPTWPTVRMNSLPFVMRQLRSAGCTLSDEELRPICLIPRSIIEEKRTYRAVAMYRGVAARSAATQTPRIKRSRRHLRPMEWVAGDAHHIDIAFQRDDGSLCTIKGVAWMDLATNRGFITPFVMPKGEMIRREHVIESFVAMCADPNWGVPTRLYLDRGGEYNWGDLAGDLFNLKQCIDVLDLESLQGDLDESDAVEAGVYRSRAYNPQSKVIEGLFGGLERSILSQLPGHIGGNRMRKKTENQGKAPTPFPGDFEAFKAALQAVLRYYHGKPQQGHLQGNSPNQRFQEFIADGWKSLLLDPNELAIAFSQREFREVRAGGVFSWGGLEYRHDELIGLAGVGKVMVGEPLFGDKSRLIVFTEDGQPIGYAEQVLAFAFGDIAGAGEQSRQAAILRKQLRAMESETDKIDLRRNIDDAAEEMGTADQAESKGMVSIGPQHRRVAQQAKEVPETRHDAEREYRSKMSKIWGQFANGG